MDDLALFRLWFYELKKCRPVLTFHFAPTLEQAEVLRELAMQEKALKKAYEELQKQRREALEASK